VQLARVEPDPRDHSGAKALSLPAGIVDVHRDALFRNSFYPSLTIDASHVGAPGLTGTRPLDLLVPMRHDGPVNTGSAALLEPRLVGDVEGKFFVRDYQRGYRWGPDEVRRLLEDIKDADGEKYYLQPVVVKRLEDDRWELVDGQQRLTTLYLGLDPPTDWAGSVRA